MPTVFNFKYLAICYAQTILELSHEIDALHVKNTNDQQQLSQRIRNFIEIDKQAISSRFQMELQINDALAASGLHKDCALMKVRDIFCLFIFFSFIAVHI